MITSLMLQKMVFACEAVLTLARAIFHVTIHEFAVVCGPSRIDKRLWKIQVMKASLMLQKTVFTCEAVLTLARAIFHVTIHEFAVVSGLV